MTPREAKKRARQTLSRGRYLHSRAVAREAAHLARRYGENAKKAVTAAWLHDCAKELPARELKTLCGADIIKNNELEGADSVLHSFAGAALAESWGVADGELLDAIRYHTTGRANMTLLDKIIFISDFSGKDRSFPEAATARGMADESIDGALGYILSATVDHLRKKGKYIVPLTLEAAAQYCEGRTE